MISTPGPASGTVIGHHEEDAGADGGADADHHQREHAQRALETDVTLGGGQHLVDRLLPQERVAPRTGVLLTINGHEAPRSRNWLPRIVGYQVRSARRDIHGERPDRGSLRRSDRRPGLDPSV